MQKKTLYFDMISTKIIAWTCFTFGLLITLSALIPENDTLNLKSILIGIGCSLIASSIVILVTSKYTFRYSKVKDLTEHWGIYGIYETRQEMNIDSNIELKKMSKYLDIIAWGLSNFRNIHSALIEKKVAQGLRIRVLCPDPNSSYVKIRSVEEGSAADQIEQNIISLTKWISSLKKNAKEPNSVELKYFSALPQGHYMRIDRNIYIGPYLYNKLSQQTISFSFKYGAMFEIYTTYFENLWNDKTFSQTPSILLPTDQPIEMVE